MKDLHIHTIYSDGELSVREVVKKVIDKNVDFFSITDHDTIEGCREVVENNLHKQNNLKFVTGIEISALIPKGKCHILGYNIDIYNKELQYFLEQEKIMNRHNIMLIVDFLRMRFNMNITDEDVEQMYKKIGVVNNVEIAKLLVRLGYCATIREAFEKYISLAKKRTHDSKQEFSAYECINIIKKADGIPVLAHNYQLKMPYLELKNYIMDLKKHGLMGLECYHSGFHKSGIDNSLMLARNLHLLITGGSDYHGPNVKPDIEIGTGKVNNLSINSISIEKKLAKTLKYQ